MSEDEKPESEKRERPSAEAVILELACILAEAEWHDVTADCPVEFEEPVTKVYITGFKTKLSQLWMLVRWADGEETLSCLSKRHPGEWRKPFPEKYQVEWLFEVVEGRRPLSEPTSEDPTP